MNRWPIAAMLLLLTVTARTAEDVTPSATETTVMEMMVVTITPASDTLWGVDDPQTDEEWRLLDDAAATIIETFEKIRNGGGGPNDETWADEAKFQGYIDEQIAAGEAARAAIAAKDVDALFSVGDALYLPCENCHIDYNPGVTEEPY